MMHINSLPMWEQSGAEGKKSYVFNIRCFYPKHLFWSVLNSKNVMLKKVQSTLKSLGMNKAIWRNNKPLFFFLNVRNALAGALWKSDSAGRVIVAGTYRTSDDVSNQRIWDVPVMWCHVCGNWTPWACFTNVWFSAFQVGNMGLSCWEQGNRSWSVTPRSALELCPKSSRFVSVFCNFRKIAFTRIESTSKNMV